MEWRLSSGGCVLFLVAAGWSCLASGVETTSKAPAEPKQVSDEAAADVEKEKEPESPTERLREGSKLVDQVGEFQKSGDRFVFSLQNEGGSLRVLENLALERVARVMEDNPSLRTWSVCGEVTEYRGDNYLMLTRAVLKSRSEGSSSPPRRSPKLNFSE